MSTAPKQNQSCTLSSSTVKNLPTHQQVLKQANLLLALALQPSFFMSKPDQDSKLSHDPASSTHELRKAYQSLVEAATCGGKIQSQLLQPHSAEATGPIQFQEIEESYRRAFRHHQENDDLAAERWARTVKHMARAFWHECKIAYLGSTPAQFPYLRGASAAELDLREHSDTTEDLLDCLSGEVTSGLNEFPPDMHRFLERGREHLRNVHESPGSHELLRSERIKAAYEYGRVVECLALAFEAEVKRSQKRDEKTQAA